MYSVMCTFDCFQVELGNLQFNLGKLEFKDPIDEIVWIISSAVGGGTLIFIIIIVIIVYKRRSADVERQNKKLQIQLDTLESNVRNECKQGKYRVHLIVLLYKVKVQKKLKNNYFSFHFAFYAISNI